MHGPGPAIDVGLGLLAIGVGILAHDLPGLALHQVSLLQAPDGLLLVPAKQNGSSHLALAIF